MRIGHAVTGFPDSSAGRHAYIFKPIGRMVRRIGVAEQRVGDHLDPWRTLVDEKQRFVGFLGKDCLEPEEVGQIGAGHVPLLAVQHVVVSVSYGRRLYACDVGTRSRLGDCVTVFFLAAHHRQDEFFDLLIAAGVEHPALWLGKAP